MSEEDHRHDERLDGWARRLSDALDRSAQTGANETELREAVHGIIVDAAADLYGLDDLSTTGERKAGRRTLGKYDRAYGGLVVEWEWNMGNARRRHGAEQAIEYLDRMRSDVGGDEAFSAVVCDGRQWGFLVADTPQGQLTLDDAEAQPSADERF